MTTHTYANRWVAARWHARALCVCACWDTLRLTRPTERRRVQSLDPLRATAAAATAAEGGARACMICMYMQLFLTYSSSKRIMLLVVCAAATSKYFQVGVLELMNNSAGLTFQKVAPSLLVNPKEEAKSGFLHSETMWTPPPSVWCAPETTAVVCTAVKVCSAVLCCALQQKPTEPTLGFIILSTMGDDLGISPGTRGRGTRHRGGGREGERARSP